MKRAINLVLLNLQFLILISCITAQYIPPNPTMRALYPVGVYFSIPDEPGITLVAFHAKFNEDFNGLEAGTIARDIVKVKNNRWTYEDHSTRVKIGDTIYLWIHVIYEGLGYNLLDQVLHVTELYNYDGTLHSVDIIDTEISTTSTTERNSNKTCYRSQTLYDGNNPCIGQLLFEEHFNQLQPNQWRIVKQFSTAPDYEFVVYQGNGENVCTEDGELRIKPTLLEKYYDQQFIRRGNLILEECTGQIGSDECEKNAQGFHILPPVASGLINTKHSFSFLYGHVEIRAKLPQGDWIYPVIKLLPVNNTYGSGYQSGELRIADAIGNRNLHNDMGVNFDGRELRGGAVVSPVGPIRESTMSKKVSSHYWGDDYHVYELEWTPTTISVKVDGENYDQKENPALAHKQEIFKNSIDRWSSPNSPFDKLFYLSIGVAVGGHGEFPNGCISGTHAKPWRNIEAKALWNFYSAKEAWASTWEDELSTLKVDYVKIWAL